MMGVDPKHIARVGSYTSIPFMCITMDVKLGERVVLRPFCNLYGCTIGDDTKVGAFVEIGRATIGKRCKVQSHSFICEGVTIEDDVFIGPRVTFTNDKRPSASSSDWVLTPTRVGAGASIGAGAVIHPGAHIAPGARVAAGAIVTKPVEADRWVAPPVCDHVLRRTAR
jgi:acetyltransferase-like isoleucine patch superfamily enzyme